jgi:hypothetical protein
MPRTNSLARGIQDAELNDLPIFFKPLACNRASLME